VPTKQQFLDLGSDTDTDAVMQCSYFIVLRRNVNVEHWQPIYCVTVDICHCNWPW